MHKSIWLGAMCAVSALAVSACASRSTSSTGGVAGGETIMVAAATKSEAASTFHMSATEQMTPISGTPLIPASGANLSGDVDLSTASARITGNLIGTSPKGSKPFDIPFSLIQIGNDSWDSTTGLGGLFNIGGSVPPGHWIKSDASSSVSKFPNPGKLFDLLKSNATNVTFVGDATVGGVSTREYQLIGSPNLFDALGGSSSDQSTANGPISVKVWVDGSDLVRRLSAALTESMGAPTQVESIRVTVDFSRYGEALHIEPPPANLVLPAS